jgi:hypothetical protein
MHAECLPAENFSKADAQKIENEMVIWANIKVDVTKISFDV